MTKIGILLEFNYEDLEVLLYQTDNLLKVWYPLLRLREAGHNPITIGPEAGKTYTSKHNYACKSDVNIDEISAQDLDALIIPGGWAPDYWRRDKRFVTLVREMMNEEKPVAAICHGPWMLCSAKCVQGRKMTCFHSIRDDIENAGAIYMDAPVVVDANLITSRTPLDLPDFCKAILAQLK